MTSQTDSTAPRATRAADHCANRLFVPVPSISSTCVSLSPSLFLSLSNSLSTSHLFLLFCFFLLCYLVHSVHLTLTLAFSVCSISFCVLATLSKYLLPPVRRRHVRHRGCGGCGGHALLPLPPDLVPLLLCHSPTHLAAAGLLHADRLRSNDLRHRHGRGLHNLGDMFAERGDESADNAASRSASRSLTSISACLHGVQLPRVSTLPFRRSAEEPASRHGCSRFASGGVGFGRLLPLDSPARSVGAGIDTLAPPSDTSTDEGAAGVAGATGATGPRAPSAAVPRAPRAPWTAALPP